MKIRELSWIYGFFKKIKNYIFIRSIDNVLILPPNKVYKLNKTGTALISHLMNNKKLKVFPGIKNGQRAEEVHNFFCDLKAFYMGCPENPDNRHAVERKQYDFNFTKLPILGEIAITYKCNNACLFCYAGCDIKHNNDDLSLQEIKSIIDVFKNKAKIPYFSFTGGEPLLRPDLEKMIKYACKKGFNINLISNATLADKKRAKSLFKAGLKTAQVSIESQNPETHDYLTGAPGSFEKTLNGIKNLREAGISVQTNTTITRKNSSSIQKLPDFLHKIKITRFSMNLYIPSGRGLNFSELFFPYSEAGPLINSIRKKALNNNQTFFWYSPIPHCHYNPIAQGLGNKSCAAMDGLISISPQGDVLPCSSYPEPMGNLLTENFKDIWFSERASFFKQKKYQPKECIGCNKFTACQSACPLYWKYAGTKEIINPDLCKNNKTIERIPV